MTNEKVEEDPRKMWDKAFDKLRHKHETWYIFRDWLDLTIDNFTIPDQTPMFENQDKYTKEEYETFGEMFLAYLHIMEDALETKPHYDFLGEWWEGDQNMTNKFRAQFFTPMNVAELMVSISIASNPLPEEPVVMNDCCCGSGRFGLAYHTKRPQDYFVFNDLDQYAVKMTIVNMLLHGMQGVVAHQNTLTGEVFNCWRVTPYLFEYAGVPYVVPYGRDLDGACSFLPSEVVSAQPVEDVVNTIPSSKGSLDAWL